MPTVFLRSGPNFQQEISIGDHVIFADEPFDVGGDDTGPDPYSLLLSALGACTAITMQMYAQRKQLPLQGLEIALTHASDYRKDCESCDDKPIKIAKLTVTITLHGPLAPEQQERLHAIAKRCPLHQTLIGEIEVTHLVGEATGA